MATRQNDTKRLAMCAMLSALGVVVMYIGSFIDVLDIAVAVIASVTCVYAVIEYGKSAPWLVFGVTAVLSLLLLANKAPAIMYTCFFGFYPILKEKFEKRSTVVSWVLKEVVFNVTAAVTLFVLLYLDLMVIPPETPRALYAVAVVLLEAVFVLYDIALTRLISMYINRLRSRLRIKK